MCCDWFISLIHSLFLCLFVASSFLHAPDLSSSGVCCVCCIRPRMRWRVHLSAQQQWTAQDWHRATSHVAGTQLSHPPFLPTLWTGQSLSLLRWIVEICICSRVCCSRVCCSRVCSLGCSRGVVRVCVVFVLLCAWVLFACVLFACVLFAWVLFVSREWSDI